MKLGAGRRFLWAGEKETLTLYCVRWGFHELGNRKVCFPSKVFNPGRWQNTDNSATRLSEDRGVLACRFIGGGGASLIATFRPTILDLIIFSTQTYPFFLGGEAGNNSFKGRDSVNFFTN